MSHSVQVADDGFADMAAESSERFYLKFSNGGWIARKEKKPVKQRRGRRSVAAQTRG